MIEIKVLESFCEGKSDESACEDGYVISEDFIAVIDGVTGKSDFLYDGKTTGKLTSEMICKVLNKLPKESSLMQLITEVNDEIGRFYKKYSFPYDIKEKGLQAAGVFYSAYYHEIWMIGDCQACVDGIQYFNPKKSDLILSDMRALVIECMKSSQSEGITEECMEMARTIILPWIIKSNVFANDNSTDYGYSVMNGEKIPESLVQKIKLDDQSHEVILASDGYPAIERTLELTEMKLKEILKSDPGCYKDYRSTKGVKKGWKSFDDRTYIRFLT